MTISERRKIATHKEMLRIATLKIKAYGLSDTPEEYIEKCKKINK